MENFKKIGIFFILLLAVMAVVGGIGYCLYNQAYVIAIAILVLAGLAFPTAKKLYNKMTE